jgi:hypothetical protein
VRRLAAWWRRRRARPVPPIHHVRDGTGRVLAWIQPMTPDELAELADRPHRRLHRPGWLDRRAFPHTDTRRIP